MHHHHQSLPLRKPGLNHRDLSLNQEEQLAAAQAIWRQLVPGQHTVLDILRGHNDNLNVPPENININIAFGNVLGAKAEGHTRVYCQNINGLRLDAEGGDFTALCRVSQEVQADVIGIMEHNIDTTKHYVQQLCYNALRHNLPIAKLTLGTTPITTANVYMPGGTFTISSGDIVSRIIETGSDEMGRWTFQSFAGCNQQQVTVITAYQVCHKSHTQRGRTTAAAQQESLVRQRNASDPNPRKHFRKDILVFLKQLQAKKHELLLIGDFNEALGEDENGMSKICSDIGLIDLVATVHGTTDIATYSRGKKRLDYALGTQHVSVALRLCGYEPFQYRMSSNHRAFFLDFDFDTTLLFGGDTPELPLLAYRDIQSHCRKQVSQYLRQLHVQMLSWNCFARIDVLDSSDHPRPVLAERLDRDLDQFCKSSAKQCRRFREPEPK
jgi:exonuclease III